MNAQTQKRNSAVAVTLVVLILLLVLGIGLLYLFNQPKPAVTVTPPAPTVPATEPAPAPAPVAAPVVAAPKMMGKHTVIPRDTLWWISDKWYQDPVLWPSIYEINKAEIRDPDLIYPGQKFDIPALTGTSKSLSPEDRSLLAQGYLEAYRVYKEKGKVDAEDFRRTGEHLTPKP